MSIEEDIKIQVEAGFGPKEVVQNLLANGYSAEEINKAIVNEDVYYKLLRDKNIQKERGVYTKEDEKYTKASFVNLITGILVIVIAYSFLPIETVVNYGGGIGFFAGLLSAFFLYLFLSKLPLKLYKSIMGITVFVLTLLPIVLTFVFIGRASDLKNKQILTDGIVTNARLVSGIMKSSRRENFSSGNAMYKDVDGNIKYVVVHIPALKFSSHYVNEDIWIVYSKKYPEMNHIIYSPEELKPYSKLPKIMYSNLD